MNVLTIAMSWPRELQLMKCYNTMLWMLYLDHVDCSFVSEQLYQCDSIGALLNKNRVPFVQTLY